MTLEDGDIVIRQCDGGFYVHTEGEAGFPQVFGSEASPAHDLAHLVSDVFSWLMQSKYQGGLVLDVVAHGRDAVGHDDE